MTHGAVTDLDHLSVAIIGAGIAGLTAATALAARGARVTVLERSDALREVGAGLQISPNAVRVFDALGLWPSLREISLPSERIELCDSVARSVARLDLARHRPKDRFRLVHRARLIQLLAEAARQAGADIRLGQKVLDLPRGADLVIGADGVKSRMRTLLNGPETPFFTGQTAWRAVIAEQASEPVVQVFMGPGRHLVSYPLAGGLRNIVAVVERTNWHDEGWSQVGDPAELRAAITVSVTEVIRKPMASNQVSFDRAFAA